MSVSWVHHTMMDIGMIASFWIIHFPYQVSPPGRLHLPEIVTRLPHSHQNKNKNINSGKGYFQQNCDLFLSYIDTLVSQVCFCFSFDVFWTSLPSKLFPQKIVFKTAKGDVIASYFPAYRERKNTVSADELFIDDFIHS